MNTQYYDMAGALARAKAGKDILVGVFDASGENLLTVEGQQSVTITRSAESVEVTSKDSNGWKQKIAGTKEWSMELGAMYIIGAEGQRALEKAFEEGTPVCVKVYDIKAENGQTGTGMFGGVAVITDFSIEAPHDDVSTATITLEGMGKLTNLVAN